MIHTLTVILALIGVAAAALVFIAMRGVYAMASRRRERGPREK
jgi:hypothetical protein